MRSFAFISATLAVGIVGAQDISDGDFPNACVNYCLPIVAVANGCNSNDDDSQELDCICNGRGMDTAIPNCDACVAPFRLPGDDDFEDISELRSACGFSSTSLPNAPTPVTTIIATVTSTDDDGETEVETITSVSAPLPSGVAVTTSVFTTTSTDDDGDVETETDSVTLFSGASVTPTGAGATGAGNSGQSAGSSSSMSPNGALQTAAPILGAGAAILMGAFAAL